MREPDEDLHALTARYFDGELADDDVARALDHLTTCAACQRDLGDQVGLAVALGRTAADVAPAPAPVIPIAAARPRRRAAVIGLAVAAVAAAAIAVAWIATRPPPGAPPPALALAEHRGVEVRFSAPAFAAHRPYQVMRGGAAPEVFTLAALADLERRGDRAALVAAQASAGELARARAALAGMPPGAPREADAAAVELLAGRAEAALDAADRALALAPTSTAARWNRALAIHALGLPLAAAAALEPVIAAGEPGWADEARARAAAWRAELGDRAGERAAFTAAAQAMVDRRGAPLDAAALARRPGLTRLYFHYALRGATTRAEAEALTPLAEALDREAGDARAVAAVRQVAGDDFARRAPLARAYRDLALGRATDGGAALQAALDALPGRFDDLRLGAWTQTTAPAVRAPLVERLVAATGDPWFELLLARDRGEWLLQAGAYDRAEVELRAAHARCDARRWAHRCAHLARELFYLYAVMTRYDAAETYAAITAQQFRASGATELEDQALAFVAEAQRSRGRLGLAAATFAEVRLRLGAADCGGARYASHGLALIAVQRGAATLDIEPPPPDACGQPPNPVEVGAYVDLARQDPRPAARARAEAWIAALRAAGDAVDADLSAARLAIGGDRGAAAAITALLPALAGGDDERQGQRAWAYQTLIDAAGRADAWADVVAIASRELDRAAPTACALVVSVDNDRGTAVALGADGRAVGARATVASALAWTGAALVPAALSAALAGCARVEVLARPPLEGRADLLPPTLAWSFAATPRASAPTPGPTVVIGDAQPPAAVALPPLRPLATPAGAIAVRGQAATPAAALAAMTTAAYVELHVHGEVDLERADASYLALSPEPSGRWTLTAGDLRTARLTAAPVVVLAACRAATAAPFAHARLSLPAAFLAAGARAVIAPAVEIPDAEAGPFFDDVRQRITGGAAPAAAVAAARAAAIARGQAWAAGVLVFE
jgi:hypothetical protein